MNLVILVNIVIQDNLVMLVILVNLVNLDAHT